MLRFSPSHSSSMAAALLSSLRRNSFPPFHQLLRLRFFSDATSARRAAPSDPHFMVEYLVNSCGFSVAEASKAAKPIAHLRSSEKPDAVLSYLRSQGFGAAHLRKMIAGLPRCLCFDVKRTLAPKLELLRSMGFSESDVVDVVVAQRHFISHNFSRSVLPRLEMWESLYGSRELLLKHLKRHSWILRCSIDRLSVNIEFLTDDCRIRKEWISLVIRRHASMISRRPDVLPAVAARVEELGVPRGSKKFLWMIYFLSRVSKDKFEATRKMMRRLGWSDDEFYSAIKLQPSVLFRSTEGLQKLMDFFVKDVGCTPSYIAQRPTMLTFSMEKRVLPRVRMMEMLKSKGLWDGQLHLQIFSVLQLTDAKFLQKFVHPYEEKDSEFMNQSQSDGR